MDNWIAQPLNGVHNIKFGMDRKDVRKLFCNEAHEFKKSKFSKNTTDDFGIFHVYYDKNDKCEAVEIFNDVNVSIDGRIVFPIEVISAKEVVGDFEEVDGSYISKKSSIGIYAPSGKMESILFGIKGYYDD
jgi:hypothetical protein